MCEFTDLFLLQALPEAQKSSGLPTDVLNKQQWKISTNVHSLTGLL
jgi:hypothetical protein